MLKFERFSISSTCHTRQLVVKTEVILERDRRQGLILVLDLHILFGFYRLM